MPDRRAGDPASRKTPPARCTTARTLRLSGARGACRCATRQRVWRRAPPLRRQDALSLADRAATADAADRLLDRPHRRGARETDALSSGPRLRCGTRRMAGRMRIRLLTGEDANLHSILGNGERARREGVERAWRVVRLVEVQDGRAIVPQIGVEEARGLVRLLSARPVT